jgi:[ribosomal protein S18]-alanine N-acetyltransferase
LEIILNPDSPSLCHIKKEINHKSMNLIFRPMILDDLPQVHEIDTVSFTLPWPERSFRFELTQNPNSHCWVMEIDEGGVVHIAAIIVIWTIMDEGHIGTIAVRPEDRGKKIGQKILAHALLSLSEDGINKFFLEVRRTNVSAQRLYQKFGFTLDGVRKRYYKDTNEDALLMSLMLVDEHQLLPFTR